MTSLSEATVMISGIQYDLSVEGLVNGRIAVYTDEIKSPMGTIDEETRRMIIYEIGDILDENGQPFEFV